MSSNKMKKDRCFLCFFMHQPERVLKNAEKVLCPGSKKPLKDVIQYIANSAKLDLKLSKDTLLCLSCCRKVISFDENMMKIMHQKRDLIDRIQKSMSQLEDEFDEDLHDTILINEEVFVNEISDAEIDELIKKETDSDTDEKCKKPRSHSLSKSTHFQCPICDLELPNKKEHEKHMNEEHKKYKCEICNFAHHNENQVILHKNTHQGLEETQCPICHKKFSKKVSTIRHMESHTDLQKYQCDKCGLRFSQSTVFHNHKMQHDAEENPLFCNICKQQFKTIKTYRRHAITHREDRPRYPCEYCSKSFADKYTLKVHSRMHVQNNEVKTEKSQRSTSTTTTTTTYVCIICDQLFMNKEQLDKHMEEDHDVIIEAVHLNKHNNSE